jgi:hypothetical protein
MGLFDLFGNDDARQHNEYIYNNDYQPQSEHHKASFTHEGTPRFSNA